jgi:FAD/FMN-containing dehydrogenase
MGRVVEGRRGGRRTSDVGSSQRRSKHSSPSRRAFLGGAAVVLGGAAASAGALEWTPLFRVAPTSAQAASTPPPDFPPSVPVYKQAYRNWSGMIVIEDAWTCAPASDADVVTLANWAHANGFRLRAKGVGHGWSPLVLTPGSPTDRYVLLDTTAHLTTVSVDAGPPATVTAQPGVTMDKLATTVAAAGYGFCAVPAPGDLTLGGVLAINGHGTAVPATGESAVSGQSYGSLSNLIVSLTAVAWNAERGKYALRTFQRSDPDIRAFLVHLGRAMITSVTLQVAASQDLRCESLTDISAAELFAAPAVAGCRSFASYVDRAGRVEAIWFPFTSTPWLKVWTLAPTKPLLSREVTSPYNYPFTSVTSAESAVVDTVVTHDPSGTPGLMAAQVGAVDAGLATTLSQDIWGQWHNVLRYVPPDTERIVESGFAIVTSRASIQRVVSDFYARYASRLSHYSGNGEYPMNGPIEIRVTGLDLPAESVVPGAQSPILSSVRPRPDHPEWDTVVWLDMGTLPITPDYAEFYADIEAWIWTHYTGSYATVRPEWSKAWAATSAGPWTNPTVLRAIPAAISAGARTRGRLERRDIAPEVLRPAFGLL